MKVVPRGKEMWLRRLFALHGTALMRIRGRLLICTLFAVVVTFLHEYHLDDSLDITLVPFTLIGLALGIFLGFRNNTSYDRYWEGRKLWGALVNTSRSLTRLVLNLVVIQPDTGESSDETATRNALRRDLVHRLIGYGVSLKLHLRDETDDLRELRPFFPAREVEHFGSETNIPVAILQGLSDRLRDAYSAGWIHPMHLPLMENQLTALTDIQGGCERIKNTPIPFSYTVLIHRIVAVYCFTLPFGIVNTTHLMTPLVVAMLAYAFMGLDAVGDEIEDPFGRDINDLPLSQLSRMIERNLRQRLGETELPPAIEPDATGTLY